MIIYSTNLIKPLVENDYYKKLTTFIISGKSQRIKQTEDTVENKPSKSSIGFTAPDLQRRNTCDLFDMQKKLKFKLLLTVLSYSLKENKKLMSFSMFLWKLTVENN